MKTVSFMRMIMPKWMLLLLIQPLLAEAQSQEFDAGIVFSSQDSAFVHPQLKLNLTDSATVTYIDVQVHDLLNDSTYFSFIFLFDQVTGLPSGISWLRNGNSITLGLGSFPPNVTWKGKIRLKDLTGTWGPWYEFLFN